MCVCFHAELRSALPLAHAGAAAAVAARRAVVHAMLQHPPVMFQSRVKRQKGTTAGVVDALEKGVAATKQAATAVAAATYKAADLQGEAAECPLGWRNACIAPPAAQTMARDGNELRRTQSAGGGGPSPSPCVGVVVVKQIGLGRLTDPPSATKTHLLAPG